MAKKNQGKQSQSQQNDTFDLSQFLGSDEIETPGEDADFGNDPEASVGSDNADPEQYNTEGLDDIGYPEKDEPESDQDDEDEDTEQEGEESDDEAESDAESDTEAEDEGEDEEAAAAEDSEAEADEPAPKKDPTIPKRRLDSEIAKRRQVEQELKEVRRQQQEMQQKMKEQEKVPEETIQQWLQDSAQKALDGETEESAKLQQKAFDAMANNRGEGQQQEQQQIDPQELVQQVEERVELKNTVNDVFDAYPQLDPNSDQFDETLNEEVLELNDFYTNKGHPQSTAVEKAVEVLAAQHQLQPVNADSKQAKQPQQKKKPARDTSPNVKKKMDVADKQPSEPSSRRGNKQQSEDTVDVTNLSDDEFMALPENVRARLRGD